MSLPDLSALDALAPAALTQLRDRFVSIGLTAERVGPVVRAASSVHPLLRRPILKHHLRKVKEPYAYAARALMFGDPIERAELEKAFGDATSTVVDTGLVTEVDGGFASGLCLTMLNDVYVWTDDLSKGGDAVMGLGPVTSALCGLSMPRRKIGRALDLGCGAGTIALVVARACDKVVATDINPRAIVMSRINARLNGIENLDLREGSLFEPVKGETFDLVSSQPPFIPQFEGGKTADFMRGGRRGDELPLALLADLTSHLTVDGRGVIAIEWGLGPKHDAPSDRIKKAMGAASADVVLLSAPEMPVDMHAAEYAAALHPTLGPEYDAEAMQRRAHCAELGLEVMSASFCLVKKLDQKRPRFDVLSIGAISRIVPNARRVDKLLEAREATRTMGALIPAKLRMVEGVTLREEQSGPGAGVASTLRAILPPKAMTEPMELSPLLLRLTTCIHEAKSVKDGVDAYLEQYGNEDKPEQLLMHTARALLGGLLEIAD